MNRDRAASGETGSSRPHHRRCGWSNSACSSRTEGVVFRSATAGSGIPIAWEGRGRGSGFRTA
ncbi:hypothetical protein [Planctomyces sp. SH-PL14]|uniref:hypothetical protein n=1 Tax=Planctomyces sp. SH-PL14 TaxID=1632864 RepID=UPI0009466410|nr:hypothetical protein [Planctomyces sp. SH-PL14]